MMTAPRLLFAAVIAALVGGAPAALAAQAVNPAAIAVDKCAAYAGLIALVVSLLKRLPFIAKNPKTVAAVISALIVLFPVVLGGKAASIGEIVQCVLAQLAMGVGVYEIAKKPLRAARIDPSGDN